AGETVEREPLDRLRAALAGEAPPPALPPAPVPAPGPEAPEAPAAPAAPGGEEWVRVGKQRLEALLTAASELILAAGRAEARRSEWAAVADELGRLRAGTEGGGSGAVGGAAAAAARAARARGGGPR